MQLHESAEDYLETIFILRKRNGYVRSIDIVNELGFSKPSISVAMKRLRENDYIEKDDDGTIRLTPAGEAIAWKVYSHHALLTEFLEHLGVSSENAAADACKMEHDLSEETFTRIKAFIREHEKQ